MITIEQKSNSTTGLDSYRDRAVNVPRAYQPILQHSVNMNAAGTNANVTVRSDDYVVATVEGRQLMTDHFIMSTKFTALQGVIAAVERARIFDAHVAFLVAARQAILDGSLPDEPIIVA